MVFDLTAALPALATLYDLSDPRHPRPIGHEDDPAFVKLVVYAGLAVLVGLGIAAYKLFPKVAPWLGKRLLISGLVFCLPMLCVIWSGNMKAIDDWPDLIRIPILSAFGLGLLLGLIGGVLMYVQFKFGSWLTPPIQQEALNESTKRSGLR